MEKYVTLKNNYKKLVSEYVIIALVSFMLFYLTHVEESVLELVLVFIFLNGTFIIFEFIQLRKEILISSEKVIIKNAFFSNKVEKIIKHEDLTVEIVHDRYFGNGVTLLIYRYGAPIRVNADHMNLKTVKKVFDSFGTECIERKSEKIL